MKIAISNIAWNKQENEKIAEILKKNDVEGIEIAPTKIWEYPELVSLKEAKVFKTYWKKKNIQIIAAQSILFGKPELTVFESKEKRYATLGYLKKIISLCGFLEIGAIVFGSPQNRNTHGTRESDVKKISADFFSELAQESKKNDIFFCIEPNPTIYGTDFINNTKEAIDLVKFVNHSHFMLHIDTGSMFINKEDIKSSIEKGFPFLKHFHASEKNLRPFKPSLSHKLASRTLKSLGYKGWVSLEMVPSKNQSNAKLVDKALKEAKKIY